MNSLDIQEAVYAWALAQDSLTAPYGVLLGQHPSPNGRTYRSVTFGRARTLDATVEIFNRNWILLRTSSHGTERFTNYDDLMRRLESI